jgi:iron only hydrogenase large subunit-like protein
MQVCPTEAIRIKSGKASIANNRCVDCGECYSACPQNAIYVEQDAFKSITNWKYRVALVPAVLIGQFPNEIKTREIYDAILELGFTHVYEVEQTVDFLAEQINKEIEVTNYELPLISSFCPSVIRLIQVKFPSLIPQIIHLKTPVDLAALDIKHQLQSEGIPPDEAGIFYITPCAAKIAAIKSPVGEEKSVIDGAINMNSMYNKVYKIIKSKNYTDLSEAKSKLSDKGVKWSLTHGESSMIKGRSLAIDGINNVIEFLEMLENEEMKTIDFLELRACDQSCAGGILASSNRFLSTERLKKRAKIYEERVKKSPDLFGKITNPEAISKEMRLHEVKPRPVALDEDITKALEKMDKVHRMMCYLPGFDCGACGAPNCESLARDIAQNEATLSHCVFMQRVMEKNYKLSPDHAFKIIEKVWGKDRLSKDCNSHE